MTEFWFVTPQSYFGENERKQKNIAIKDKLKSEKRVES